MSKTLIYYLAAFSALVGPLWMPDTSAHGWPVAAFAAWAVVCWSVFVWNAPRPSHWPTYCACCGGIHRGGDA